MRRRVFLYAAAQHAHPENSEVLAVSLFSFGTLRKSLNLLDLWIFHLENEDMTVPV